MKCPKCLNKLVEIKIMQEDDKIIDKWIHPTTAEPCEYSTDGTEFNIIDNTLFNHFQEIIKEKGIEDPIEEKINNIIIDKVEDNDKFEIIKLRLAKGDLTLTEYDQTLDRLK